MGRSRRRQKKCNGRFFDVFRPPEAVSRPWDRQKTTQDENLVLGKVSEPPGADVAKTPRRRRFGFEVFGRFGPLWASGNSRRLPRKPSGTSRNFKFPIFPDLVDGSLLRVPSGKSGAPSQKPACGHATDAGRVRMKFGGTAPFKAMCMSNHQRPRIRITRSPRTSLQADVARAGARGPPLRRSSH